MSPSSFISSLDPPSLSVARKRELIDQVLNSQTFLRASRLREFLIYVAECTLSGRLDDAREQHIAERVFRRKPGYNPGQDNIVRVEARLLRKRLESYFAEESRDSDFVITMPKGSYALSFDRRESAPPPPTLETFAPEPLPELLPGQDPDEAAIEKKSQSPSPAWLRAGLRPALLILASLVLLALFSAAGWWTRAANAGVTISLPLSAVLNQERETYVVTSDASLIITQDLLHQRIGFDDYVNHRYPTALAGSAGELLKSLPFRDYTDAIEVSASAKLLLQPGYRPQKVFVRSARQIGLPELKERNVILLGSPESNPWGALYYENLPFQFDNSRVGLIHNLAPRASEPSEYLAPTRSGEIGDAYAVLALVPNIDARGSVLLIAGTTAEATGAAAEFVLNQRKMSEALRRMGIDPTGPPQHFEILLKARTIPGSAARSCIEAWRRI